MVVKPSASHVYIFEWAGGLFVAELVDRLFDYSDGNEHRIAYRPLSLPASERLTIENKLERFASKLLRDKTRVDNELFPLSAVVPAWGRHLVRRSKTHGADVVDDLSQLFCSKVCARSHPPPTAHRPPPFARHPPPTYRPPPTTFREACAVCYKHAGLLPKSTDTNEIFPKVSSAPAPRQLRVFPSHVAARAHCSLPRPISQIYFHLLPASTSHPLLSTSLRRMIKR